MMKFWIPAVLLLISPILSAQGGISFGSGDEDIVDSCLKFADTNKDKKITRDEARELRVKFLNELKEAWATEGEDDAEEKAFEVEIKYAPAEYVLSPYMFAAIDTNRDQKLTKSELKAIEDGDYEDISSSKVMDFVFEEEWQLLSDVFGTGKDKEFDHEVLKKMAADTDYRYTVETYAMYIYMALSDTLMDFEMAELDEGSDEEVDLTKIKITKKDTLKKAEELWKEWEEAANAPMTEEEKKAEAEAKAAKEQRKKEEDTKKRRR